MIGRDIRMKPPIDIAALMLSVSKPASLKYHSIIKEDVRNSKVKDCIQIF